MSHPDQLQFVARLRAERPDFFSGTRVLEVGSLDINGSIRRFFEGCDYTGVDVGPGPGVDVVADGADIQATDPFDVVCSCEMFEHNPRWRETWRRMVALCRPGGLVFFSCATTGRAEHGTTRSSPADSPLTVGIGWEHYKNLTADDFRSVLDLREAFEQHTFVVNDRHKDLYFFGIRR